MYRPDSELVERNINTNPVPAVLAHKEMLGMDLGWGSISQGDFTLLKIKGKSKNIISIIDNYIV